MKYTNNKNNISEILKVYIINSITKSYILNINIRPLVTEYALTIKLVGGKSLCILRSLVVLFWYSKSTISYTICLRGYLMWQFLTSHWQILNKYTIVDKFDLKWTSHRILHLRLRLRCNIAMSEWVIVVQC
jgi:hypothetical protein